VTINSVDVGDLIDNTRPKFTGRGLTHLYNDCNRSLSRDTRVGAISHPREYMRLIIKLHICEEGY
jgi:hypothetical protein